MLFIDNNDSVFCIAQICRQYTRGKKSLFMVARLRGHELSAVKHPPVPHRKVPFWNDAVNRMPIWDDAVYRMLHKASLERCGIKNAHLETMWYTEHPLGTMRYA